MAKKLFLVAFSNERVKKKIEKKKLKFYGQEEFLLGK